MAGVTSPSLVLSREHRAMLRELVRFVHDDSGAELVEWAVITVIVLAATGVVLVALRSTITTTLGQLFGALEDGSLTRDLPR